MASELILETWRLETIGSADNLGSTESIQIDRWIEVTSLSRGIKVIWMREEIAK